MRYIDKDKLLTKLENQVELHLKEAVRDFQNRDEEELLEPSPDGGWSVAQCLEHLNRYGKYYLPQIELGLNNFAVVPNDTFTSSWLGGYFIKMMDPKTGKRKIKAFRDYIPPVNLNAHAVVAEFLDQQELLLTYLSQARSVDLNAIRIPISILKWLKLKLGDVFQFIIAHNERHLVQAKRNLFRGSASAGSSDYQMTTNNS